MQNTNDTPQHHGSKKRIATNIFGFLCVFLFMAVAAIMQSGRLWGHSFDRQSLPPGIALKGDTTVINTSKCGESAIGYSGPVPLEIFIVNGKIDHISALDNSETPGFFKRVVSSGLLDTWNGLTPDAAADIKADAVTGATFSSKAVIANVEAGLKLIADHPVNPPADSCMSRQEDNSMEHYAVLAVIIAAISLPLFWKNKKYRIIQQLLNVGILGFWGGTFVDYTMLLNIMSNGLTAIASLTVILLLVAAFIYPLFGKDGYYCAWVCPLGSLQELATRCNTNHRIRLGNKTVKALTSFRMILWGALTLCLWTGMWLSWIDYELFTAFIIENAAMGVLIAGGMLLILSLFIPRPYCRFVCPTGTLLRMSQNIDNK